MHEPTILQCRSDLISVLIVGQQVIRMKLPRMVTSLGALVIVSAALAATPYARANDFAMPFRSDFGPHRWTTGDSHEASPDGHFARRPCDRFRRSGRHPVCTSQRFCNAV